MISAKKPTIAMAMGAIIAAASGAFGFLMKNCSNSLFDFFVFLEIKMFKMIAAIGTTKSNALEVPSPIPESRKPRMGSTKEAIEQRYNERYALYCAACHHHIDAAGDLEAVANTVIEEFLK